MFLGVQGIFKISLEFLILSLFFLKQIAFIFSFSRSSIILEKNYETFEMSEEAKEKKGKNAKNIGRTECYTSAQTMAYRQQAAVISLFGFSLSFLF